MATTTAFKNQLLDSATITHIQLHSAATADGTTNLVGTKTACTYGAASNAERDLSAPVDIAVTAGSTVSHYSFWNNSTYLGSKAFTVAETYSNNGTARVTSAKLTLSDL